MRELMSSSRRMSLAADVAWGDPVRAREAAAEQREADEWAQYELAVRAPVDG